MVNRVSFHFSSSTSPFVAFNWKQKLLLKEDQQIEETSQTAKFLDYGRLQNVPKLEKFFNSMKGVEATDGFNADEYFQSLDPSTLPDLEDYQISILTQGKKAKEKRIRNPKYKIVRATLFGSHKVGFKLGSEETKKKPKFVRFGKNTGEITA